MTLEELEILVQKAKWFDQLTQPLGSSGFLQITSLGPWANIATGDHELERIADQMNWLPSSKDQDDPIHGMALERRIQDLGMRDEYSRRSLEIYKKALVALRHFDGHPALQVGPHDFTEAARGAALYACRRAAYEILLGDCGFWCSIMNLYKAGHWPCGILPNNVVVVL